MLIKDGECITISATSFCPTVFDFFIDKSSVLVTFIIFLTKISWIAALIFKKYFLFILNLFF